MPPPPTPEDPALAVTRTNSLDDLAEVLSDLPPLRSFSQHGEVFETAGEVMQAALERDPINVTIEEVSPGVIQATYDTYPIAISSVAEVGSDDDAEEVAESSFEQHSPEDDSTIHDHESARLSDNDHLSVYSSSDLEEDDQIRAFGRNHKPSDFESIANGHKEGQKLDYRSFTYIKEPDENLLCPICKTVFIDPVTTHCDHVFCKECFEIAYEMAPSCPIDRKRLGRPHSMVETSRIIVNMLDALDVYCPNSEQGCTETMQRALAQDHIDRYCEHTLIKCPAEQCDRLVPRMDANFGCLHFTLPCKDCHDPVMQSDLKLHREKYCVAKMMNCPDCDQRIIRVLRPVHQKVCTHRVQGCKWTPYGCTFQSKRKDIDAHHASCAFRKMGRVIDELKNDMENLMAVNHKQALDIRDMQVELKRFHDLAYCECDATSSAASAETEDPYDSRDQYLLSQMGAQDEKIQQLIVAMQALGASDGMRHNELISLNQQIVEMRSNLGQMSCHVRWLMNLRLRDARPGIGGAGGGPSSGSGDGPGERRLPGRRLSDTGGGTTKL